MPGSAINPSRVSLAPQAKRLNESGVPALVCSPQGQTFPGFLCDLRRCVFGSALCGLGVWASWCAGFEVGFGQGQGSTIGKQ